MLLDLPPEVRLMIIREIYVSSSAIGWPERVPHDKDWRMASGERVEDMDTICTSTMAVCWQWYNEASTAFWRGNTFALVLRPVTFETERDKPNTDMYYIRRGGLPLQKIRNFKILVGYNGPDEETQLRSILRFFCQKLVASPTVQHIEFYFVDFSSDVGESCACIQMVSPFSMLRDIGHVRIHGLCRGREIPLESRMMSSEKADNISAYNELYAQVKPYPVAFLGRLLRKARDAAEEDAQEKFRTYRIKILEEIKAMSSQSLGLEQFGSEGRRINNNPKQAYPHGEAIEQDIFEFWTEEYPYGVTWPYVDSNEPILQDGLDVENSQSSGEQLNEIEDSTTFWQEEIDIIREWVARRKAQSDGMASKIERKSVEVKTSST